MWTILTSETDYALIREARDENAIRGPKSVLWKLRKNPQYFAGKLLILQQQRVLDILNRSDDASDFRYHGYFVFPSKDDVTYRFESGQPLSCFCLDQNHNEVHVAYHTRKRKDRACAPSHGINYLTYSCTQQLKTFETGVIFRQFAYKEENTKCKDEMNITDYAIMLPYFKAGSDFQRQFTLVYSDWTVLTRASQDGKAGKGHAPLDIELFGNESNLKEY